MTVLVLSTVVLVLVLPVPILVLVLVLIAKALVLVLILSYGLSLGLDLATAGLDYISAYYTLTVKSCIVFGLSCLARTRIFNSFALASKQSGFEPGGF